MTSVPSDVGVETDALERAAWLYADESCVVAVKPSGVLSVPGRSIADCHWARVRARFEDLLVVHRLDMATSGLIVYARGPRAQRVLSRAFAERAVDKHYVAEVAGFVEHEEGEIDLPLAADWPNRPLQQVDRVHGRPALTRFRVLARNPGAATTRLSLHPITGRSHQLRVAGGRRARRSVAAARHAPRFPAPVPRRTNGLLLARAVLNLRRGKNGRKPASGRCVVPCLRPRRTHMGSGSWGARMIAAPRGPS